MSGANPILRAEPLSQDSESVLLSAVADGDADAFRALHRRYHSRVLGFALRIVGSSDRAEEIASDAMLAVWRGAGRFEGRSSVSSWIFGIAYRTALKTRRRFRFERRHVEIDDALGLADEQAETVEAAFVRRQVAAALRRLPMEHRALVQLTYYYGMSYPEIAAVTGCPVGTVKSRMALARKKMRHTIEGTEK